MRIPEAGRKAAALPIQKIVSRTPELIPGLEYAF